MEKLVSHALENWDFILANYHENVKVEPINEMLGTQKNIQAFIFTW